LVVHKAPLAVVALSATVHFGVHAACVSTVLPLLHVYPQYYPYHVYPQYYPYCMCIHSTTLTACVSTVLPLLHVSTVLPLPGVLNRFANRTPPPYVPSLFGLMLPPHVPDLPTRLLLPLEIGAVWRHCANISLLA
jgi:hypothetical protein